MKNIHAIVFLTLISTMLLGDFSIDHSVYQDPDRYERFLNRVRHKFLDLISSSQKERSQYCNEKYELQNKSYENFLACTTCSSRKEEAIRTNTYENRYAHCSTHQEERFTRIAGDEAGLTSDEQRKEMMQDENFLYKIKNSLPKLSLTEFYSAMNYLAARQVDSEGSLRYLNSKELLTVLQDAFRFDEENLSFFAYMAKVEEVLSEGPLEVDSYALASYNHYDSFPSGSLFIQAHSDAQGVSDWWVLKKIPTYDWLRYEEIAQSQDVCVGSSKKPEMHVTQLSCGWQVKHIEERGDVAYISVSQRPGKLKSVTYNISDGTPVLRNSSAIVWLAP